MAVCPLIHDLLFCGSHPKMINYGLVVNLACCGSVSPILLSLTIPN